MQIAFKKVSAPGMPLGERLLARLIDLCTGRKGYFHCELRFDHDSFTADPQRGVVIWKHPWEKGAWTFYDIGSLDYLQIREWCRRQVQEHDRYSFIGCAECVGWIDRLTWPIRKTWRLLRRHIKPLRHHAAHMYCSLAVFRAVRPHRTPLLRAVGWRVYQVPPNSLITACHLAGYTKTES